MDLQEIRNYVRTHLDLTTEDLADVLIDRWAAEGVTKIQRAVRRWSFYESSVELVTEGGIATYAMPLKQIDSIVDENGEPLQYMSRAEAQRRYLNAEEGCPTAYSVWANQITFWPEPDTSCPLMAFGYREPIPMGVAAGDEPDLPTDFHEAVLDWVMARAMGHQEDPEMSVIHEQRFEKLLATLATEDLMTPTDQPLIWGGERPRKGPWSDPAFGELRLPRWDR